MKATGITPSLVFVNRYSDEFSSSLPRWFVEPAEKQRLACHYD